MFIHRKSVCVQYLIAIKHLKSINFQPLRTIILTYVPDEEIGGYEGMNILLNSTYFLSFIHNIAVAFDEGLASEDNMYSIFYGERYIYVYVYYTYTYILYLS